MKQTVRCTQSFCKCGTPARACRHSVVEPARQITQGPDKPTPPHGEPVEPHGEAYGVPAVLRTLGLKGGAEMPDFAIPLAEKAESLIAAFDLLSDEAWASLPEPVWTQIQSAADHLQLAIFNYKTKGAQA